MTAAAAQTRIFASAELLAQGVADWIVDQAGSDRAQFSMCLSGGETPKRLYEILGTPAHRARMPWDKTHWFWGDERVVPHDDPRSNFHMAWEALLRHVPVPRDNVHPIPIAASSPPAAAAAYETTLKTFYGHDTIEPGRSLFDVTLLGLGEDGHIASLFPGSPALAETRPWVVPVVGERAVDRITLTYPALAASAATAFLVAGARKRQILTRLRSGEADLPAARLRPAGVVIWFVDRAASGE
jgi:6-phosphogluconolactonase